MKDILIIHKINSDTGEARRKEVFKVSASTKRSKRKDFAILPPRGFFKAITRALNFLFNKENTMLFITPQPLSKPIIKRRHFHDKRLFYLTKPFDDPLILIKILRRTEIFIGIGQELFVLHKSSVLILTLSRQFSLPRAIENSLAGIVDSQERRLNQRRLSSWNN